MCSCSTPFETDSFLPSMARSLVTSTSFSLHQETQTRCYKTAATTGNAGKYEIQCNYVTAPLMWTRTVLSSRVHWIDKQQHVADVIFYTFSIWHTRCDPFWTWTLRIHCQWERHRYPKPSRELTWQSGAWPLVPERRWLRPPEPWSGSRPRLGLHNARKSVAQHWREQNRNLCARFPAIKRHERSSARVYPGHWTKGAKGNKYRTEN